MKIIYINNIFKKNNNNIKYNKQKSLKIYK